MLYDKYSATLFPVCRRYISDSMEAEDVFITGMWKIFKNIGAYKFQGSFEGWMRRIMVNESLMHLRKKKIKIAQQIEDLNISAKDENIVSRLSYLEILELLDKMPTGYRTVFNLYLIEGFKHREIAEKLGISINTSKSQLILAKKKMKELIENRELPNSQVS